MKSTVLASQQESLSQTEKAIQFNFDMFITIRLKEINELEDSLSRIVASPLNGAGSNHLRA